MPVFYVDSASFFNLDVLDSNTFGYRIQTGPSYLLDNSSIVSVDWASRALVDDAGVTAVDWGTRRIYDTAGIGSLSGDSRLLIDSAGLTVLDWENRVLVGTASYADLAGDATAVDIFSLSAPVDSYLLMSNVIATSGAAIGGNSNIRYNSSTNVFSVGNISATTLTGSLQGTASSAEFASTASYASYAVSSSYAIATVTSASYAATASKIITVNEVGSSITHYPVFANGASGPVSLFSDAVTYTYQPSTNILTVTASAAFTASFLQNLSQSLTLTGSMVIEASAATAALRVTQLGSGEAFRVEDTTTPDSTAFIVDSSGSVGIGLFTSSVTLAAPLYPLHIIAPTGVDAKMVFDGKQFGNGAANANITIASDTTDKVSSIDFLDRNSVAYSGTATYNGSTVKFLLDRSGSSAPLATGGRRNDFYIANGFADRAIIFHTSASDGNLSSSVPGRPRLAITGSNVGIGTITPQYRLDVSGSAGVTGNLTVSGNTIITGSVAIGTGSVGSGENNLLLGPAPAGGAGEGGQIALLATNSGSYTSSSFLDNWQNQFRILRGPGTTSNAGLMYMDLQSGNTQFVGAVTASAYNGLPNDYLYVTRNTDQTVGSSWASTDIIFNNSVVSKGISYNTGTGLASLIGGKVYRITARLAWSAAAAYLLEFSCYNSSNTQLGPTTQIVQSTNGSNNISDGALDFIYAPSTNVDIKIRTTANTTALSGEKIRGDLNTQLIIQQIA